MRRAWWIIALMLAAMAAWIGGIVYAVLGATVAVRPSVQVGGFLQIAGERLRPLGEGARAAIVGVPLIWPDTQAAVASIAHGVPIGRSALEECGLAMLAAACVLAAGPLAKRVVSISGRSRPRIVFGLLARDLLDLAVTSALALIAARVWFASDASLDLLAVSGLWGIVRWRVGMRILAVLLRPRVPEARLIPADSAAAAQLYLDLGLAFGLGIAFISVAPVLLTASLSTPAARAMALITGFLVAAIVLAAIHRFWRASPWLGRAWRSGLTTAAIVVLLAWSGSVLVLEFSVYHAVASCLWIATGAAIIDRLLAAASKATEEAVTAEPPSAEWAAAAAAARRPLWIVAVLAVVAILLRCAIAVLLGQAVVESLRPLEEQVLIAAGFLIAGYACYEAIKVWAQARFGAAPAGLDPSEDEALSAASRLNTVMPIMLGFLRSAILVIAALSALAQLGINISPLIAGAGILGLAVSFGSQALVRDIVSGLFYLVDDGFRVGEYIDTGRQKGTVERISLRSLRLRHQNGQFHTIPFGQLGSVTNFSRDWTTIKFNLRLSRATDLEQVRKLTKQLGQELLADPEFGPEFILPLKLQGLADIHENALLARFKFTARPQKPTWVQREVVKRIFRRFAEKGIEFATNAVIVRTQADGATAGAAAAAGQAARAQGSGSTA